MLKPLIKGGTLPTVFLTAPPCQLIGILLEVQATGRLEGTPWLIEEEKKELNIDLPKGEDELFSELYEARTAAKK